MKTLVITALLFMVYVAVVPLTTEEWSAPAFCHGYDCPRYTVKQEHETFEERLYYDGYWLVTCIESFQEDTVINGFQKLYRYMGGENKENLEITMTTPVVVEISHSDSGEENVSISLYVSPNTHVPTPSDSSIWGVNRPEVTMYVRVFGGIALEPDWLENIRQLQEDLTSAGKQYNAQTAFAAGYDPPWRLISRHNEVWIPAQ